MKFATFAIPAIGGVWTATKMLRVSLASRGHELIRINFGTKAIRSNQEPFAIKDRSWLTLVTESDCREEQSKAIYDYLISNNFDAVFIDVIGNNVATNLCRYLPDGIKRIMIVHSISSWTMKVARKYLPYVHAVVVINNVQKRILQKYVKGDPSKIHLIPHAICRSDCRVPPVGTRRGDCVSLGRLENDSKNIFLLPKILKAAQSDISLDIFGDGPDRIELEKRCRKMENIHLKGSVYPDSVQSILEQYKIYLFPSRYEGLGMSLLEAMAAGCVPIAARIPGVTDMVIENGVSGFLFEQNDFTTAAQLIDFLLGNPAVWEKVSCCAIERYKQFFSVERHSLAYEKVACEIQDRHVGAIIDSIDSWCYDPVFSSSFLRAHLPENVKKWLRKIRFIFTKRF